MVLRLNHSRARPTESVSLGGDEIFLSTPETAGPCILAEAMVQGNGAGLSLLASALTASKEL